MRCHKSKDRKYNNQIKMFKETNNSRHNTIQKTRAARTPLKPDENSCAPEDTH